MKKSSSQEEIRVIGVNVSEILIKGRGNFFKTMSYASTSAFGSLSIKNKITDIDGLSRGK